MGTPFRHRLLVEAMSFTAPAARCSCGVNFEDVGTGLAHVRLARRWRYLGREYVYDEPYYMWEHALTGRQYAWLVKRYEGDTLS